MYINPVQRYYSGTQQHTMRAPFLLLFSGNDGAIYGAVRQVAMRQLGHWMVGSANVGGRWITVSGAYGNDGLTINTDAVKYPYTFKCGVPRDAVLLPADLAHAWAMGGGWNGAGSEATAMRAWARETFSLEAAR